MKTAIFFEIELELKRQFNIALAKNSHEKKQVLTEFIKEYIRKTENRERRE